MDRDQVKQAFVFTCSKTICDMFEIFLAHPMGREDSIRAKVEYLNSALLSAKLLGGLPVEAVGFSKPQLTALRKNVMAMMTLNLLDHVWVEVRNELWQCGVPKETVEQISLAQLHLPGSQADGQEIEKTE